MEPWLSSGASLLDTDPNIIFLNAVGLLLLLLGYLLLKPFLPTFWDKKDNPKVRKHSSIPRDYLLLFPMSFLPLVKEFC